MPSYHYNCAGCGTFEAIRVLSEFALPTPCPGCGQPAPRSLAAPAFSALAGSLRVAHATNEQSAHAPKRQSAHASNCACCRPLGKTASGAAKSFPGARPWMISH